MLKLAVIGADVSKSQSPPIHTFLLGKMGAECTYEKRSLSEKEFAHAEALFKEYDAFNVTVPYKRAILPFLRKTEGEAERIGAVNFVMASSRTGYNTDGWGFLRMLDEEAVPLRGARALVLGAGGAGRACIHALMQAGAEVFVYNRSAPRLKEAKLALGGFTAVEEVCGKFDLIVNCTGVGASDSAGILPEIRFAHCDLQTLFSEAETAVDLAYEPAQSAFLLAAGRQGCKTLNGAAMLFYQAYLADCILLRHVPDRAEARRLYREFQFLQEKRL